MGKLRIAMISDAWYPFWGGGQTHIWEVSKRLVDNYNYTVDIYSLRVLATQEKNVPKNLNHVDIHVFLGGPKTKDTNLLMRFFGGLQIIYQAVKNHKKHPYDLIHSHGRDSALYGKIISLLIKKPQIHTVHGTQVSDLKSPIFFYMLEQLLLTKIKFAQEISVSKSFLQYPNVNTNVAIIPNGISSKSFNGVTNKKNDHYFNLLWVGRFDPMKGLTYLIEAVAITIKSNKNIRLTLIGDGKEKERIEELVKALDLTQYVSFPGSKYDLDLVKEYQKANLFVLSSLAEGQPITLLEAWASKLPVLVTRVGDMEDYVTEGVNGLVVSPGSSQELAEKIIIASTSIDLKKMGVAGYRLVAREYTWDIITRKIYEIYKQVLQS